jgi:hypothetical protein
VVIEPIRPEHRSALERGFAQLSEQAAVGVARFVRTGERSAEAAVLLSENREMLGLLESLGQVKVTERESGTVSVEVPLERERPGAGKGLNALLRIARRVAAAARSAR